MKFTIQTKGHSDMLDITKEVEKVLYESKVKSGIALVFTAHSTAAITVAEYENGVVNDLGRALDEIAPEEAEYDHHKLMSDSNGAAHVKAAIIGPDLAIPVENGELELGAWQQIIFIDFDDKPREREVIVKIIADAVS